MGGGLPSPAARREEALKRETKQLLVLAVTLLLLMWLR